jgi:hypothetical protein
MFPVGTGWQVRGDWLQCHGSFYSGQNRSGTFVAVKSIGRLLSDTLGTASMHLFSPGTLLKDQDLCRCVAKEI